MHGQALIAEEEALVAGRLHHRPSYSLLKGGEDSAPPSTLVRQVSEQDFDDLVRTGWASWNQDKL